MPGGIIQLVAYGGQDFYLTGNPQISFFKNVYRRHTNFSMEMINIEAYTSSNELNETNDTVLKFKINRNADLIREIYFLFTIPDIFSDTTDKFQWIDRIGEYIIKEAKFTIGSSDIDILYPEWFHIWNELTIEEGKRTGYNKMIGNITDLTNPQNSSGSYPTEDTSKIRPTIKSRQIIVPLPFWFTYCVGSALPLISLQYETEPEIRLTLRGFGDLYTIVNTDRKKDISSYNLGKFTTSDESSITSLDISPSIEVNYIFLDNDERKRFADAEHQYLINTLQRVEYSITPSTNSEGDTNTFDLKFQHPISNLMWYLRRSDFKNNNQFYNFTNRHDRDIEPIQNPTDYNEFGSEDTFDINTINSLRHTDILKSATLKFNGVDRFNSKTANMFNLVNNYQHMKRIPEDGIYVYSFNLNLDIKKHQPNGACNFSYVNDPQMEVITIPKAKEADTYSYDIQFFALTYNVFRIIGGMGALEYSN